MNRINVAVIGCGTIARTAHVPAYTNNSEVEIKWFCDLIPERAKEMADKYGRGQVTTDYHDILKDKDVVAVSVCTPNNMHAPISIDCLKAGKHVLCEKPTARTYAEALTMQKAQHDTGKILNIGVVNRFNDSVNQIKRMIDAGELGEVYHVDMNFRAHRSIPGLGGAFTTSAIAGGGVLIDWGVHFLDIVMYCCGDPAPRTVSGETFCKLGKDMKGYAFVNMWAGPPNYDGVYDVDDSVTALVRTAGPVISLHGAWAQNIGEGEMFIDFIGDKAGIRLQYGKEFNIYSTKNGMLTQTSVKLSTRNHFQTEIDAFINCIKTGEKAPSHIDAAVITSRIMQAIYDSAKAHTEVKL